MTKKTVVESERPVTFVSATRVTEKADAEKLAIVHAGTVSVNLIMGNERGLPEVYNEWLTEEFRDHIVAFVHDDVSIESYDVVERLREAVSEGFTAVGLAGTRMLIGAEGGSPFWWLTGGLSGQVAHRYGDPPEISLSHYGVTPSEVKLLDGLFLAVDVGELLDAEMYFDEQFKFHFYDMDFCLRAHQAGLKLTTWPINVIHGSIGATTPEAKEAFKSGALQFFTKHDYLIPKEGGDET